MGLYYECHITIAPVEGLRLERFKEIAAGHGFHVAKLLMEKSGAPNGRDAFCTARDTDYEKLQNAMNLLVNDLLGAGFKVWRFKIEDTLLDIRLSKETT